MTEPRRGLSSVVGENFSPMAAVGGVRGIIEAILPSLLFIIVFPITGELMPPIIAAVSVAAAILAVRVVQRIDITPAMGGFLGVVVSAVWAWRSGQASSYFQLGLWTNLGYLVVFLVSILVTWPIIGVLVAFLRGEDQSWRTNPEQGIVRRRYYVATWLWAGMFGMRLAVQGPLYFMNAVEALGLARLVMGPFLFALVAWLTWMLVRRPEERIVLGHDAARADRASAHDESGCGSQRDTGQSGDQPGDR